MKKLSILFMCMVAMFAAGTSLKAQEITITLWPGCTWISYPNAEAMSIETAFGGFTPMDGDIIKSQSTSSVYSNGVWVGGVTQFMPGCGYKYYSKRTEAVDFVFAQSPNISVTTMEPTDINGTSAVVGSTVTIGEGNHVFARGVCWGTEEMPTVDGSHTSDEAIAGSQTVTLVGLSLVTTYYVRAYAVTDYGLAYGEEQSFTTESHDYVDLGLPSGTLWATCNVGADTPEGYGDYFAWGETQPKSTYTWSNCQYCIGSNSLNVKLTKYCSQSEYGYNGFTDDLTMLSSDDDAATANLGAAWRMPTQAEWQELLNNTTHTWTTQNGVNGRLFTASNGNSLFLPAAGFFGGSLSLTGECGYYKSSSRRTDDSREARCYFFDNTSNSYMEDFFRYYGQSVRAVRHKNYEINVTAYPLAGGSVSGGGSYMDYTLCTLTATANGGFVFENWTENGVVVSTEATYTFTVNGNRNLVANFCFYCPYVDLGLPSGLLWATCNVGADTPEGYGDYFAWGETQPKNTYNSSTYTYSNNPAILPSDHDAATANWGAGWRMPSRLEWQELLDNTTHTWTTQNGVNGWLFTASNSNSLFLPAAGMGFNGPVNNGSRGYYWSREVNATAPSEARFLYFESSDCYTSTRKRYFGCSVRPVRSPDQK